MSLAVLHSRALAGMDAPEVVVEVHLANGLPSFTIVGLPEAEVKESKDRVRAALQTAQFEFPTRRITVNLAPADLPKESGRYDLPIALGILAASGQIPKDALDQYEIAGELALTGELRPVRGALAMTASMIFKPHQKPRTFILPKQSAAEAALVKNANILAADSLLEVCAHLSGRQLITPYQPDLATSPQLHNVDFSEVKGQASPKRALEVAAAGGHSILMAGPPGTGKSMLASRFSSILPSMSEQEALEAAAIQSLNGAYQPHDWGKRPFRAPHHTASGVALVGGGNSGVEAAIDLAGIVGHVTLIEFGAELRADAVLQRKLASLANVVILKNAQTMEVLGDGNKVNGLVYKNRDTDENVRLELEGIFVQIGLLPNTDWLKGTLNLSKMGEIEVDSRGQTSATGIFAAGDCTTVPYKQIIIAMGEGAKASLGAFDYLIRSSVPS